jgi:hypothetical protein
MERLRRLLVGCLIWAPLAILAGGPGLHLIEPCDHAADADAPDGGHHDCPVCSFAHQGQAAPPPLASFAPAPVSASRVEASPADPAGIVPGLSRPPRAPPAA